MGNKYVTASMRGLEFSKRSESFINRKVSIFYIETVLNYFFQLRKIFFLRSIEKIYMEKSGNSRNFFDLQRKIFKTLKDFSKKNLGLFSTKKISAKKSRIFFRLFFRVLWVPKRFSTNFQVQGTNISKKIPRSLRMSPYRRYIWWLTRKWTFK